MKVNIRTQGQQNSRIKVIWTILECGKRLASLLIFKGKDGEDTVRKLQQ